MKTGDAGIALVLALANHSSLTELTAFTPPLPAQHLVERLAPSGARRAVARGSFRRGIAERDRPRDRTLRRNTEQVTRALRLVDRRHARPNAHLPRREDHVLRGAPQVERRGQRRSEEHTSELQSRPHLVCRLLLE